MKIAGYLCCMMGLVYFISRTESVGLQDKMDRQLYDASSIEDSPKDKRPFCNAFTGCGKKRSENSLDNQVEPTSKIRIPMPIYRALLRAADREIRESVDGEANAYDVGSDVAVDYPPIYFPRKMQNRERYSSQ